MAIDNIKIRMYRHGFGDCFLLRFFEGQNRTFTMLIDCGLKHGDKVAGVPLSDVVKDIREQLNESKTSKKRPKLDVLVATHEHWDHVSGFHPDLKLFDDFLIGKIWMAWTENPDDKEAVLIQKHLRKSVKALKLANEKVKKAKSSKAGFYDVNVNGQSLMIAQQKFGETLQEVTEFFGPLGIKTVSGITLKDKYKISINTQEAMQHLKSLASGDSGIQYYYPGDLIQLPAKLPGVRIYVLGPPKSALLNKDKPSTGAAKEVYFGLDNYAMTGFINGLLAIGDADEEYIDDGRPFNGVDSIKEADAKTNRYFKNVYFDANNDWREIGDEWLNMSGALAMQLDDDTNNTSLALAFELVESGKVLLFPADAQVGNWLSWHEHEWEVKNGQEKVKMNAQALLENTVFYKAGHHLSHNATLKTKGLEMMKSNELVCFIPEKEGQYNGIPYDPLIKKIKTKTNGRYIFSADSNHPAEKILKKKPLGLDTDEWLAFKSALEVQKLYVEYTLKL
jgi:hypothetical protein